MKILSIETSCDDTGISILEAKGGIKNASFKVLADNLSSQIEIHIPYGGVFPALAKREHIKNLPLVLEKTLKQAKLDKKKCPVDLIAVTYGPGLEPALWTGIVFAKELSKKWNVPIIPVNHMEGHMLSVFGKKKGSFKITKINYPALGLLVSGGHTELVLSKKFMDYKIIGQTLDDAVGEAFDKVARMLSLPYPGGPQISKLAELERALCKGQSFAKENVISLPRPMLHSKNFDFSFSGLKTAVLYLIKKIAPDGKLDEQTKSKIALEFENASIECLTHKTSKVIEKYNIKTLFVAGGVAANKHLRNEMKKITNKKTKLMFPTRELSTDNAVMIGIVGYLQYMKKGGRIGKTTNIKADGNLKLG
jgi:N6-L-threonylcarbamoyladenine synthase